MPEMGPLDPSMLILHMWRQHMCSTQVHMCCTYVSSKYKFMDCPGQSISSRSLLLNPRIEQRINGLSKFTL